MYLKSFGSWRGIYVNRPRLKFNGVYIAEIKYSRKGVAEGANNYQPLHLVTFFRYIQFFPYGLILNFTTLLPPEKALEKIKIGSEQVQMGEWKAYKNKVWVRVRNKNCLTCYELTLGSTFEGAHDILNLERSSLMDLYSLHQTTLPSQDCWYFCFEFRPFDKK